MRPDIRRKVLAAALRDLDPETVEARVEAAMALAEDITDERQLLLSARTAAEEQYAEALAAIEQQRGLMQARCPHWSTTTHLGCQEMSSYVLCDLCGSEVTKAPN